MLEARVPLQVFGLFKRPRTLDRSRPAGRYAASRPAPVGSATSVPGSSWHWRWEVDGVTRPSQATHARLGFHSTRPAAGPGHRRGSRLGLPTRGVCEGCCMREHCCPLHACRIPPQSRPAAAAVTATVACLGMHPPSHPLGREQTRRTALSLVRAAGVKGVSCFTCLSGCWCCGVLLCGGTSLHGTCGKGAAKGLRPPVLVRILPRRRSPNKHRLSAVKAVPASCSQDGGPNRMVPAICRAEHGGKLRFELLPLARPQEAQGRRGRHPGSVRGSQPGRTGSAAKAHLRGTVCGQLGQCTIADGPARSGACGARGRAGTPRRPNEIGHRSPGSQGGPNRRPAAGGLAVQSTGLQVRQKLLCT